MVKRRVHDTAESESDADVVQAWEQNQVKRMPHKRGPYKTMNGKPVMNEQQKKEAAAQRQKRYMMKKTLKRQESVPKQTSKELFS